MKRLFRCVSVILVIAMCLAVPVSAIEEATPWASNYFVCRSAYLYKTSDNQFQVWFNVSAFDIMNELGTSEIKVQRSSDKETWTTMSTYKKAVYPQMIGYNTGNHSDCVTYYSASSGFYYRAYVEFYAKNSSGTAYYGMYTDPILI